MMNKKFAWGAFINCCIVLMCSCIDKSKYLPKPYTKPLEIIKLSENQYVHVSYIKTEAGDFIPCNGFIYVEDEEALVFETPLNDSISNQLIDFVEEDLNARVKGVIVHHFHEDAAGGVNAFAKRDIPSYASQATADLLLKDSIFISNPFIEKVKLTLGEATIESRFFGEAHTSDNTISYIYDENVLVGGCMIKAEGGAKGNLADANLASWSTTVQSIKDAYPDVERVIPGHGTIGGKALLDYTIDLFMLDSQKETDIVGNLE